MIPEVINTIEHTNAGQVEVAIPVYAAVKLAHEDGIKVMFSGQAADELFGGYSWYGKIVKDGGGYAGLRHYMNEDIQLLYKETLEREDKITMAHSIEMREPFLDLKLIRLKHEDRSTFECQRCVRCIWQARAQKACPRIGHSQRYRLSFQGSSPTWLRNPSSD